MPISVLSVASECVPLVKTGGLADVVGALPGALAPHGVGLTTLVPGYPAVLAALKRAKPVYGWNSLLGEPARLLSAKLGGEHPLLVLDAPGYFARDGGPYSDVAGQDWQDNGRRFAALGRAAADIAGGAVKGRTFDLCHAHDWQAGLALAYLRYAPLAGSPPVPGIVTIHNIAFQGRFGVELFPQLGLPARAFALDGVEYHGGVGFLKAGMQAARAITTVSPRYAREIRLPEFGMGLEGLVVSRAGDVRGILNGIDQAEWNPARDPALAANYDRRSLPRRALGKAALAAEFGLVADDGPLFIVVSRLAAQKGIDVICEVADHLVGSGGRLAVLGSGDAALVAELGQAVARHPGRIALYAGYDEALAHRMIGGGDALLVPSRFEPCGLTQLYALAYGCVPVVARTGGLADTVIDANIAALGGGVATGVVFDRVDYPHLAEAVSRTVALYHQRATWRRMQANGMAADFSWGASGAAYAALYAELLA